MTNSEPVVPQPDNAVAVLAADEAPALIWAGIIDSGTLTWTKKPREGNWVDYTANSGRRAYHVWGHISSDDDTDEDGKPRVWTWHLRFEVNGGNGSDVVEDFDGGGWCDLWEAMEVAERWEPWSLKWNSGRGWQMVARKRVSV